MLKWAREWRGHTLEDAARRVNKKPEDIAAWERVTNSQEAVERPTVKQARSLADLYDRSFLEFFRSEPPPIKEPDLVPDFRMHRGADKPNETHELKIIQGWAEAQRQNALDLYAELGDQPPIVPSELFVDAETDVDIAASNARQVIRFSMSEQFGLRASDQSKLPEIIRHKFETAGILTLRHTGLSAFQVRGICIFASLLPVVVFANETSGAQCFTLAHELGHVVLKQSGISGKRTKDNPYNIERWCDQFAASFLMPKTEMTMALGNPLKPPLDEISDDRLEQLATRFRVSQHAMLVRLVNLGYVNPTYYWGVKKPLFDAQEAKFKSFARSKYYGSRYRNSLGRLYTGLVIEAWNSGKITNHSAAEYMGIKNFEHLFAIRDHFRSS
jgi:Zn-dependent peptidase ImmA (M78 family)/transcriptional regulator with XRE-family HTH domain